MRAAGFVSIAFGLALAAGAPAQAGEGSAASTKVPAAVKAGPAAKAAPAAKAKPATRAKVATKSKAHSKSNAKRASAAETSAAASQPPVGAPAAATAAASSGSLLGSPAGEPSVGQVAALAPLPAGGAISAINPYGFPFRPGVYHCELDRSVDVRQVAEDLKTAVVQWDKQTYTLHAVGARTGALRYEDAASGLVWLVIAGKSMLLDTKSGKQLANECRV